MTTHPASRRNSVTGAGFGYTPSWTAFCSFPLMAAVQIMCARLGMVTGLGLAGVIRVRYPRLRAPLAGPAIIQPGARLAVQATRPGALNAKAKNGLYAKNGGKPQPQIFLRT